MDQEEKGLKSHFLRNNMNYQFWLYEGGNVNAAIDGAGGYEQFSSDLVTTFSNDGTNTLDAAASFISQYPDASIATGICAVVVGAPMLKNATNTVLRGRGNGIIDAGTTIISGSLLGYAVAEDTSFITVSAAAFVMGSSFLKYALNNPFFMKMGGLTLAAGGVALSVFGIEGAQDVLTNPDTWAAFSDPEVAKTTHAARVSLPVLTAVSGAYVASSSLLMYEGGIYETVDWKVKNGEGEEPKGWVSRLTHPARGLLSKMFERCVDRPVQAINTFAKSTMLRYIPRETRENKPFFTSMWAKAPWRPLTSLAAVLTGQYAFAASNAAWAGGDVMIGIEDCKNSGQESTVSDAETAESPINTPEHD